MIRLETPADYAAIRHVEIEAFGQIDEADIVDRLREEGDALLSLVAEVDGRIVGHVLFSPLGVPGLKAALLAPVAVLPEYQRKRIGAQLIEAGIASFREQEFDVVALLGHPEYYPRFGFSAELGTKLQSPFERPSWMALELRPGALDGDPRPVTFAAAFELPDPGL